MWLKVILSIALIAEGCFADNYAVLVAGSSGWFNYRHQADICHAYQVLKARGFPESNIITLMFDDIANSEDNPLPGQIINKPNGPDVYKGVTIDYKGEDLTPKNFLNIISGNEAAMKGIGSGRVLKSGSDDLVFINFVDHGGTGLLCFPEENLYADDLENTLRGMAKNKQFKKLLFYVEACEAGSMFDNILEEHNNIIVSTASARDESSFGFYCSNPQIDTCLGDLFSISWMEHMDDLLGSERGNSETLWHQYDVVRTRVNESHVQLYGDFKLGLDTVDVYFGKSSDMKNKIEPNKDTTNNLMFDVNQAVPSREVEIHTAKRRILTAPEHLKSSRREELRTMLMNRKSADRTMHHLFKALAKGKPQAHTALMDSKFTLDKSIYPCYKNLVVHFNKICFNAARNTYLLKYLNKFVNVCHIKWISEQEAIQAMKLVCSSKTRSMKTIF